MTLAQAESLIVAVATVGALALLTEQHWKPSLIEWLTSNPVVIVDCRRAL